jgi:hypothetical protein
MSSAADKAPVSIRHRGLGSAAGGEPTPGRLQVLHRVAGRVRVEVSPREGHLLDELCEAAGRLSGVEQASVGASRRNLVLRYCAQRVDEQTLMMRLALALSAQIGYRPVQVLEPKGQGRSLSPLATAAGVSAAGASLLRAVAPTTALAGVSGWAGALLTLAAVSKDALGGLLAGRPRPESLSLLHLLSRLSGPGRGSGALLTWLLFNGDTVAERFRGARAEGVELAPVALRGGVGDDDEGLHFEIVTRPIKTRGGADGSLLTPATIASALIGYVAYALRQEQP